jgi:hypothetical protein
MANKVLGMHRLKNKVNRNAFDLSHRHMFTAQVGELLPVFTQWVNPNETFKIGYNGKTRTAALNTDAFTRIRENIQYYFLKRPIYFLISSYQSIGTIELFRIPREREGNLL